jgi:hypothetical protein
MKKRLLLVEVDDNVMDDVEVTLANIQSLQTIPNIHPDYHPDVDTFFAHWRAGISARRNWEVFSNSFFSLLTESGMVDSEGDHFDEYTFGSICEFVLDNQDLLFKDVGKALKMMIIPSISGAKGLSKKGKKLDLPWNKMAERAQPMAEIVLHQVVQDPARAVIMMPVLQKYFKKEQPALPEATQSEN